jgi:hypothetical protein
MTATARVPVPRDRENDYTREAADARREFVRERTGADLEHVSSYSFDPGILAATSSSWSASRRSRSAWPARCSSTASAVMSVLRSITEPRA